ncbi:hypothetical protein ACHAXT_012830 [Thalassiosira profunda]
MDAFIGIDIDVEPPAAPPGAGDKAPRRENAPIKPGAQRKRPRSTPAHAQSAITSRKRPRKPPPPPAPPSSLVSLLKTDSAVRSYFQSLQENLDYDVDKWRHEAAKWKRAAAASSPETNKNGRKGTNGGAGGRKRRGKPKGGEVGKDRTSEIEKDVDDDGSNVPITDEALFGDMGSDDSSHSSASEIAIDDGKMRSSLASEGGDVEAMISFDRERTSLVLGKLREAKRCLDLLGVSLVEVEVKTTEQPLPEDSVLGKDEGVGGAQNENDTADAAAKTAPMAAVERILHRQSDEKVAAEMMASLRTLIKTSSCVGPDTQTGASESNEADESTQEGGNKLSHEELIHWRRLRRACHPFCRGGQLHVPTVYFGEDDAENDNATQHPAAVGLRMIVTVLSTMECYYCGDEVEDGDWSAIFGNESEDAAILEVGMRNRCRLPEMVLSSLDVEITRVWALTDRSANLNEPTIHFHPEDVLDPGDPALKDVANQMYAERSYNRLVALEERIAHARIATTLHHRHGNLQKAAELVVGFIISSAPSLCEKYPTLPPPLSMCVLEALLAPPSYAPDKLFNGEKSLAAHGWFEQQVREMFATPSTDAPDDLALLLLRAIAYPVHVAASIWAERSRCSEDRIRDMAIVEVRAYERVKILGSWLSDPSFELLDGNQFDAERVANQGSEILSTALRNIGSITEKPDESKVRAVVGLCCTISLLVLGDEGRIIQLCESNLPGAKESCNDANANSSPFLLPACCSAYSITMGRKWQTMKLGDASTRREAVASAIEDKFDPILESIANHARPDDWPTIDIVVQCCVLLGDGRRLLRLAMKVIPSLTRLVMAPGDGTDASMENRRLVSRTMASLVDACEIPTVRIINLERRPDRALDFMGCAVNREQLIVIRGPTKLRPKSHILSSENAKSYAASRENDEDCLGGFAFDGKGTQRELESQLKQRMDGKGALKDFVADQWRPSDLKAFDRDARDDFKLVRTSNTEKACALSHVASWMGVESTLSQIGTTAGNNCELYGHEWYEKKLLRMFKISGFARGPAMLQQNDGMDPVPVCVVLEDDAVLHDRFAERLASLLEELPRDFHFCSLGYSRPKYAPMVEYSAHLGIPSCLWYLTGYVLSLAGARHLIQSLPVVGPVDSWIGLKMCANFENKFGDQMGVGKFTKAHAKLPSRKDLAKIVKFRAFAALAPLCEQKVGTAETAMSRGGWRDKDTDIAYSGATNDKRPHHRKGRVGQQKVGAQ